MQAQTEQPTSFSGYPEAARQTILNLAVAHANATHANANIQRVPADQLANFLARHKRDGRYQLLVEKEGHYFALDILQQGDQKSCIMLDAANDDKSKSVIPELEALGVRVLRASGLDQGQFATTPMQTDADNSALFALDHCIQLAQAPNDLHTTLQTSASAGSFTWDCLPPNFLRNTQSFAFIEQYLQKHANSLDVATKQYIQTGLKEYDENGTITTRNDAINVHVFLDAQRLYQKEQLLAAMTQAIQESDHSWDMFDKRAKKIELIQIKQEFAQTEVSGDPFNSPAVLAFDAAVEQTQWRQPNPKATVEYRSQMQAHSAIPEEGHAPAMATKF